MKVYSQLEFASLENLAATPAGLPLGRMWFNTVSDKLGIKLSAGADHAVMENLTQTLTNKTLTSPTINGGTITSASLVTPTVDVATLDGQASTPSSPSAGNYKVYVKDSTQKLTVLNSSGVETTVGSGSGVKNYITNGDAEASTTGWATYADAAATRPVDGTGGSPNVTWTTSSTTPLEGSNSFIFTKDAANRQGQGASFDFEIDSADQARVLDISFDYVVGSGTFTAGTSSADSDVIVYLYDKDNAVLIEPSSIKLLSNSTSIADKFQASFQTASNSNSYRLILHCASTSASAYTLKIDNVRVSPSQYVFGTPITDWQSYTPTFNGFGTPTNVECFWRRVGSDLEISASFTAGTTTGVEARIGLPTGFTSQGSPRIVNIQVAGCGGFSVAAANQYIPLIEASVTYLTMGIQSSGTAALTKISSTNSYVASGQRLSFTARVPIVGLSSSVQMSDRADTRVVAAAASGNPASATSGNPFIFPTSVSDTHGAYSTSTGRFTCPVSGIYEILLASVGTAGEAAGTLYVYKNGSIGDVVGGYIGNGAAVNCSGFVSCVAGDIIDIRPNTTINLTGGMITFKRLSGPSQIAANELVATRCSNVAGTSIANNTISIIDFATKAFDTHGAVTTGASWKFTAPIAGKYHVAASALLVGNTGWAVTEELSLLLYKNGVLYSYLQSFTDLASASSINRLLSGSDMVDMVAGDYIDVRILQVSGGAILLSTATGANKIAISRQGF